MPNKNQVTSGNATYSLGKRTEDVNKEKKSVVIHKVQLESLTTLKNAELMRLQPILPLLTILKVIVHIILCKVRGFRPDPSTH